VLGGCGARAAAPSGAAPEGLTLPPAPAGDASASPIDAGATARIDAGATARIDAGATARIDAGATARIDARHDAQPVVACTGYDRPDAPVSPRFAVSRTESRICDLPDRILLVDRKVTALARPTLTRTTAPIAKTERLGNRCGGPGGGHAGCSITYVRFWSRALGAGHLLEFGTNAGNVLIDEHGNEEACREEESYGTIAMCSTAKRYLLVRFTEDANDATPCWHVTGRLWEGAADVATELAGDVDRSASRGTNWVYAFPATSTSPAVALSLDGHKGTATLEVGGEREDCIAFRP